MLIASPACGSRRGARAPRNLDFVSHVSQYVTKPDGDYIDYYIQVKRSEWQAAPEQITQWELDRYLQLF